VSLLAVPGKAADSQRDPCVPQRGMVNPGEDSPQCRQHVPTPASAWGCHGRWLQWQRSAHSCCCLCHNWCQVWTAFVIK